MRVRVAVIVFLMTGVAEARSRPSKAQRKPAEVAPAPVAAPAPTPTAPAKTLDGAILLYQNAQFAESISVLDVVVRQGADVPTLKQAKLYTAMNFLALGNEPRAQSAFQELLDLDPDFVLPTFTSPSVRQSFARVKTSYKIIPVIVHTPPPEIDALKGAGFAVTVKRMRPGYEAKMFYRAPGSTKFSRVDLSRIQGDAYVASLPEALLMRDEGYSLEYYLQVSEGPDRVLASLRSAVSPFVVPVAVPVHLQQVGTPVYKKWWLWTAIGGGLIAAAAVTTAVIVTSQVPPTGQAAITLKFP